MAQVRALGRAGIGQARSTRTSSVRVGVRINIDVLNAQQVYRTCAIFQGATTILNGLRLKAASGTLGEVDVEEVNRLLGAN
jgi:outer membrane protein